MPSSERTRHAIVFIPTRGGFPCFIAHDTTEQPPTHAGECAAHRVRCNRTLTWHFYGVGAVCWQSARLKHGPSGGGAVERPLPPRIYNLCAGKKADCPSHIRVRRASASLRPDRFSAIHGLRFCQTTDGFPWISVRSRGISVLSVLAEVESPNLFLLMRPAGPEHVDDLGNE